jgi:hypothetical protein
VLVTMAVEYSCKLIITLTTGSNPPNNFTAVICSVTSCNGLLVYVSV